MRRKRKVTRLRPAPILWLLFLGSTGIGLAYSPITSVVRARVDGARPFDEPRLRDILAKLQGIPGARINAKQVETEVLRLPEVRSAELTRNIFGSALLKVRYRRPIARVKNTGNVALTIDGVLYPANELGDDLPVVSLPPGEPKVMLTFAGNWQPVALAKLTARAREMWPGQRLEIALDDRGSVCLNMEDGRVVLGSPNDYEKKLDILEERLRRNPGELRNVVELNLTAPENPTVVRKKTKP